MGSNPFRTHFIFGKAMNEYPVEFDMTTATTFPWAFRRMTV
ncbi:MAG: hypothetical protein M2R45_04350 [Verrucomicrobia subdivision 3 bacterium]|nr:hypothetical protein [Limisphaerales bacterium]MCS1416054.1 hypothetical protein [Limisphaerales bacterium]